MAGVEGAHRRRHCLYARRSRSTATTPDLVERQFTALEPNKLWVADITYPRSWEGLLYRAVVIEACSRKVVGWAMADHLRTELVSNALGMANFIRKLDPGLIHHSARGSQYMAYEFGRTLRTAGILASMGRVGLAFDNAMAETFFATLKTELVYRYS